MLTDCLDVSSNAYPLVDGLSKNVSESHVYYTNTGKTAGRYGEAVYLITAGENVTINSDGPVTGKYPASGLTLSGEGIYYTNRFYQKEDATASYIFSYNLGLPAGKTLVGFSAGDGTVTPSGDIYHCDLTMPGGPVTINAVISGEADLISYLGPNGESLGCTDYIVINSDTKELRDGWYVLTDDVVLTDGLNVRGDAKLILCDGKTLEMRKYGINVLSGSEDGSELTIFAQSEGRSAGSIVSRRSLISEYALSCSENSSVTINGGNITAEGGSHNPGIRCSGVLIINNGNVTATGSSSCAGITCNDVSDTGSTVVINGGTVKAAGGDSAAGIGGNKGERCGTIVINGGDVTAEGGYRGAGIGSGDEGGISLRDMSVITITGGTVKAIGGAEAAGIGGGCESGGLKVTITGGDVTAIGDSAYDESEDSSLCSGAGIGGGRVNNYDSSGCGGEVTITGGTVTASGLMAIGKSKDTRGRTYYQDEATGEWKWGESYYDEASGTMKYDDLTGEIYLGGESGAPFMKVGVVGKNGAVSWVPASERVSACKYEEKPRTVVITECDHHFGENGECEWCGSKKLTGDVDGDGIPCTLRDAIVLVRYIAGWKDYGKMIILANADLDADGVPATPRDAMILARYIAGWKGYETLPYKNKNG